MRPPWSTKQQTGSQQAVWSPAVLKKNALRPGENAGPPKRIALSAGPRRQTKRSLTAASPRADAQWAWGLPSQEPETADKSDEGLALLAMYRLLLPAQRVASTRRGAPLPPQRTAMGRVPGDPV